MIWKSLKWTLEALAIVTFQLVSLLGWCWAGLRLDIVHPCAAVLAETAKRKMAARGRMIALPAPRAC